MGGRGVTILAAFQSRAQLLARWGEHAAATILNNTGAVMVFGGTRDRDDLQFWSTLTGDRDEPVTSHDLHGRGATRTVRKVPVLAPAQIANLPTGKVLVIRRGLAPVVGRVQPAWRRRDVRTHHHAAVLAARASEAAALDAAAAESSPVPVPVPVALSGEDGWEIPADWFADTALPAPDPNGDDPAGGDGELEGRTS
jgi:type IV secretion system protein VirD4